jgi:non-specific serine/threonine protein kinase
VRQASCGEVGSAEGSRKENVVPTPTSEVTDISLAMARTARRTARATISARQIARGIGDLGLRHGHDALRRYRDIGNLGQVPIALLQLGKPEIEHGRPDRAVRLVAAAGRGSEAIGGTVLSHRDWAGIADIGQWAAALVPADEITRGIREGRAMSIDEAIAYALHETPEDPPATRQRGRHGLTAREQEVLVLVADGRTDGEIAEALFISKKTASVHVASVNAKLGAGSRAEIVALALRGGLVGDH